MRRAHPFLTPLLLLLALPASAATQSMVCAWDTPVTTLPALSLFAGEWEITLVDVDDDSCDPGAGRGTCADLLFGLEHILVPYQLGYQASLFGGTNWSPTKLGNEIRSGVPIGAFRAQWGPLLSVGPFSWGHSDLRGDHTHSWCASSGKGGLYVRAAIARDLRWGPAGLVDAGLDVIGLGDNHKYIGPGRRWNDEHSWTLPHERYPGSGFPVQTWRVRDADQARTFQRRFLEEADNRLGVNFTTYEMQLWGSIRRYTRTIKECATCEPVQVSAYSRHLGGEIRVVSYIDHRIGLPDVDPPRLAAQMRIRLGNSSLQFNTVAGSKQLENIVEAFCGTPAGCGHIPHTPAAGLSDEAGFGFTMGSAEEDGDIEQLCSTLFEQNADEWFEDLDGPPTQPQLRAGLPTNVPGVFAIPEQCATLDANPLAPDMEPGSSEVLWAITGPGETGRPVTEQEKRQDNTGRRIVGVDTLQIHSQGERYCIHVAQHDSTAVVSQPLPPGDPRPPPVPVGVFYNICATRLRLPILPEYPVLVPDAKGCITYNGHLYCDVL